MPTPEAESLLVSKGEYRAAAIRLQNEDRDPARRALLYLKASRACFGERSTEKADEMANKMIDTLQVAHLEARNHAVEAKVALDRATKMVTEQQTVLDDACHGPIRAQSNDRELAKKNLEDAKTALADAEKAAVEKEKTVQKISSDLAAAETLGDAEQLAKEALSAVRHDQCPAVVRGQVFLTLIELGLSTGVGQLLKQAVECFKTKQGGNSFGLLYCVSCRGSIDHEPIQLSDGIRNSMLDVCRALLRVDSTDWLLTSAHIEQCRQFFGISRWTEACFYVDVLSDRFLESLTEAERKSLVMSEGPDRPTFKIDLSYGSKLLKRAVLNRCRHFLTQLHTLWRSELSTLAQPPSQMEERVKILIQLVTGDKDLSSLQPTKGRHSSNEVCRDYLNGCCQRSDCRFDHVDAFKVI